MPPNLLAHYFYLWETTVVRQAIETAWISASSEDIRRVSGTSSVTTISSEERGQRHEQCTVDRADHDLLQALERWVEQGVAPEKIIATHYVNNTPASGVQFQRPLCPFPQVARYTVGDATKADSFKCVRDELDRDPRDQPRK